MPGSYSLPLFSLVVCRISTKKCFRSQGASILEMLFKFSSVWYFSMYHDWKRRTEVPVLFFVFFEAMFSLKAVRSSSIYLTTESTDAGTSSTFKLVLAIFSWLVSASSLSCNR